MARALVGPMENVHYNGRIELAVCRSNGHQTATITNTVSRGGDYAFGSWIFEDRPKDRCRNC